MTQNHHPRLSALALAAMASILSACGGGMAAPAPGPVAPAAAATDPAVEAPLVEGRDFVVFHSDGSPASLEELIEVAGDFDAVLLGEQHNDPITHRVQMEIFRRSWVRWGGGGPMASGPRAGANGPGVLNGDRNVVLTLEMFERDVQYILDEYMADLITETHFQSSARPWGNYDPDYRRLVEFAKANRIPVVAANAPRRYVNLASRLGRPAIDALPESARRYLPPLPYPAAAPAYKAEWDALMGDAAMHMQGDPLDGQTLWDASMGHAITTAIDSHANALVVHLAGGFHVENHTGTPDAIQHYRPGTRSMVVAIRPADDPAAFGPDRMGLGDFVVLTQAPPAGNQAPPAGN